MSFLETVLAYKRSEIDGVRQKRPLADLKKQMLRMPSQRSFANALRVPGMALIAEVKKTSPSRGELSKKFNHVQLAQEYERGGAHALSVLTDEKFFQGSNTFIQDIKQVCGLPILRKDFIIDEYQVYESNAIGADAILLIVKALSKNSLMNLYRCAEEIGLDVLVETHTKEEIEIANAIGAKIIGVNNRDLDTFEVSLQTSIDLGPRIRDGAIAVSESGIKLREDVVKIRQAGFQAVLIGEGLVTTEDRSSALRKLVQV